MAVLTGAAALLVGLTADFDVEGFTATLEAAALDAAAPFDAVLDAEILEPVAFGATFAVLWGIALLFLEDATALPVLRESLDDARARLFVALRRAAAAFFAAFMIFDDFRAAAFEGFDDFEGSDALFLRVFWATTNRAEPPRPC